MSFGPQQVGFGKPAIPVDITDESYNDGLKFRSLYDFSGASFPLVLKFVITKDIDLTLATQNIYDGSLRYRVFAGGVEGGVFTDIPQYPINNKSGVGVASDSGMAISVGGTLDVTGVDYSDIIYLKTSGSGAQAETVPAESSSMRGFPATTAYVVIDQIPGGNNSPSGLVKYEWAVSR